MKDDSTYEKEARMYESTDEEDGYNSLKKYISLLNPKCSALFQRPKPTVLAEGPWFENKLLGVNTLGSMMKNISKDAKLSQIYTNHCVPATAITLWTEAGLATRHIMMISGHKNEQSLKHYNSRPSTSQLKECSNVLSSALGCDQQSEPSTLVPVKENQVFMNPGQPPQIPGFPAGFFTSCQINTVQVNINQHAQSAVRMDLHHEVKDF